MNPIHHHYTHIDMHHPPEAGPSQTDIFEGEEDWMPQTAQAKKEGVDKKITDAKLVFPENGRPNQQPKQVADRKPVDTNTMDELDDVFKEMSLRKEEQKRGFVDLNINARDIPTDENVGNPEPGVIDKLKSAAQENVQYYKGKALENADYYKEKAGENAAYYADQAKQVAADAPENLRYYGNEAKEYAAWALFTAAQSIAGYAAAPLKKVGEVFQNASRNLEQYSHTQPKEPEVPQTPGTPEEK